MSNSERQKRYRLRIGKEELKSRTLKRKPTITCQNCFREYKGYGLHYCSNRCRNLKEKHGLGKLENHPNWRGGWKNKLPSCCDCGKTLSSMKSIRCVKCKSIFISGKNNWKWIIDRTQIKRQLERNNPNDKQWKYNVYKRDGFKCKIANEDCNGKIEAHHILSWKDYPELRYNINNGITLCHAHHPRKRAEEKLLIPDFQELVEVSKNNFCQLY